MVHFILELFIIVVLVSSILYYFASLYCTWKFFRQKPREEGAYLPPVTVLKPISDTDNEIYQNLRSHLMQDYPRYQVVFGLNEPSEFLVNCVERLKEEFPDLDIELVISERTIGPNPKVCNLVNIYKKAKYDVMVMNDADTRVIPEYLRKLVAPFKDPKVGAVTCMYKADYGLNFSSAVEFIFLNVDYIPSILVAHSLGLRFAFGPTIAIRKKVLEEIGGLPSLAKYLTEDYVIGQRILQACYRLHLSDYVVPTVLPKQGLKDVIRHLLRWVTIIRVSQPKGYFFRMFTMGTTFSIFLLFASNFASWALSLFFLHLCARYLTALVIEVKYISGKKALRYLWLLFPMDLIIFGIWLWGLFTHKVSWGGRTFYLLKGGEIAELTRRPKA